MAKTREETLRFIYGIFLSVLTVYVGVLFIMQTWSIYRSAAQGAYTVENISTHFKEIAAPVWVWIAAVVGNIVWALAIPEGKKRPKATVEVATVLERTKKRLPTDESSLQAIEKVAEKEVGFRKRAKLVCGVVMLIAAALCLTIMLDVFYIPVIKAEFFAAHDGVVDRLAQSAILSLVALGAWSVTLALHTRSRKREQKAYLDIIAQAKLPKEEPVAAEEAPATPVERVEERWEKIIVDVIHSMFLEKPKKGEEMEEGVRAILEIPEEEALRIAASLEKPKKVKRKPVKKQKPVKKVQPKKEKPKKRVVKERKGLKCTLRIALAVAGVALVVMGIQNGGMKDVLLKAINICTQCIGLG